jgi:hypothetical protein
LTRHELKEQLQHDQFSDAISSVVHYTVSHRERLIRLAVIAAILLILVAGAFWFASYRTAQRQQDLQAAFSVLETPVGPASGDVKTFPTQQAKTDASLKALSHVVDKDGNSREGMTARYYRGTLRAQNGDAKEAEADLSAVANSNSDCSSLAKIALAQLYVGQNKVSQARSLLTELVNKPTDLVSKAQAQLLLAQMLSSSNPQEAKKIVQSLKSPGQNPAVTRAADQVASELSK